MLKKTYKSRVIVVQVLKMEIHDKFQEFSFCEIIALMSGQFESC